MTKSVDAFYNCTSITSLIDTIKSKKLKKLRKDHDRFKYGLENQTCDKSQNLALEQAIK